LKSGYLPAQKDCHPERSEGSGQTDVKHSPSWGADPSLTLRMTPFLRMITFNNLQPRECSDFCVRHCKSFVCVNRKTFFCAMKKSKIESPSYFTEEAEAALIQGLSSGSSLSELMAPMLKRIVESALNGELKAHLETEREQGVSNRRNGLQSKTVRSEYGPIEIETSRDRNGSFEPQLIGKHERQFRNGVEQHIMDLYSHGMSYATIRSHIKKLYGTELSEGHLTNITDSVLPELEDWRNRPLSDQWAIVYFDGIRYKVRSAGQVVSMTVYAVIGVDMSGNRDVLGFYMSETESAKYWLQVFENLKQRGVKDILFICSDNLTGIGQAIEAAFPNAQQQLCIVHQIRNSVKYLNYKDYREFTADLKKVYQALDETAALAALEALEEKWGKKYPPAIANWKRDWERLRTMFEYSAEIRRLIYTTNPIEGFNRQLRKITKTKGAFTSEDALKKLIFVTIRNITEQWSKSIMSWNNIYLQLKIHFNDRIDTYK
jgi:transposase-like protein